MDGRIVARVGQATLQYTLTDDQLALRDTIRQLVRERVWPRAAEIDERDKYPWDIRELFAEHDLLALPFAEEHGGTGFGKGSPAGQPVLEDVRVPAAN
ncbi:MAG TPA: acyl-CoA dehydrogenase family protein, partial [Solirubrobacteraceae bacterium]|nr:acyl-CoA dehydrogenase family protein [Solirubrobacteraceae bacterium]